MSSKRPNIVFVVADDTTPMHHSCYGGPTPTPHTDRLADNGVRFTQGFGNASLCCPSRWTMFTGQFTQRSLAAHQNVPANEPAWIAQNGMLEQATPTLAKTLQAAGYFTGHIGKWHSRFDSSELGLDEPTFVSGNLDDPAINREVQQRHENAVKIIQTYGGFDHVDRVQWGNLTENCDEIHQGSHNVPWMTDGALEFLDKATNDKRPFYLHYAHSVPHSPDCQKSLGKDHRYTLNGKLSEAPKSHPSDDSVLERMRAAGLRTDDGLAGVNAGQIMIDDAIGELIAKLDAMGELENTIFVYTADHGVPGKGSCLPIGQHLPAIIHWPQGIPGGQVRNELFSWVDWVPTLAEACNLSMPADHHLDGVSVFPQLKQPNNGPSWPRKYHYHEMGYSRSITDGQHWLIQNRLPPSYIEKIKQGDKHIGTGQFFDDLNGPFVPDFLAADQLYSWQHDPYCQVNIYDETSRQNIRDQLITELENVCATLPRPFPKQPDSWLASEAGQQSQNNRRKELDNIVHYPAGFTPRYWYENINAPSYPDPQVPLMNFTCRITAPDSSRSSNSPCNNPSIY